MRSKTFFGTMLVGGTALGAGMLGLPIATAGAGFIPTWIVYLLCWLFAMATGLLFVEIGLWMPENANIVSMANRFLGFWGKWVSWVLYIFLFYCLLVAYVAEGGNLVSQFLGGVSYPLSTFLFALFFGYFIFMGTKIAGKLNALLMCALVLSYLVFVWLGAPKIDFSLIQEFRWGKAFLALPILFTAFSYQGTVPSLFAYLDRDPKKMRFAIVVGTTIPFVTYVIWDLIVGGVVPLEGEFGLYATKAAGRSAILPLSYYLGGTLFSLVAKVFAFLALSTSLIGVGIGLLDFLADSLSLDRTKGNRFLLTLLIFLPPIVIAITKPSIFLEALGFAGGIGCALLLGLLPLLMTWVGRYRMGYPKEDYQLFGGKLLLSILILFVFFEVIMEIGQKFSLL